MRNKIFERSKSIPNVNYLVRSPMRHAEANSKFELRAKIHETKYEKESKLTHQPEIAPKTAKLIEQIKSKG